MHDGIRKLKLEKYQRVGIKQLPEEITEFQELLIDHTVDHPPYDSIISAVFTLDDMVGV